MTTNLAFSRREEIVKDKVLVVAMVDRLTPKAYLTNMNGQSYRVKETQKMLKTHRKITIFETSNYMHLVVYFSITQWITFQLLSTQLLDKEQKPSVSSIVRNYIFQTIPGINLCLKSAARDLNMSERTLQRKLLAENTSYQAILDGVKNRVSRQISSLVEISFLLGFES